MIYEKYVYTTFKNVSVPSFPFSLLALEKKLAPKLPRVQAAALPPFSVQPKGTLLKAQADTS